MPSGRIDLSYVREYFRKAEGKERWNRKGRGKDNLTRQGRLSYGMTTVLLFISVGLFIPLHRREEFHARESRMVTKWLQLAKK